MDDIEIRHFHLFCGLGGGARGFNRGRAQVGQMRATFRCIGGVDVDPASVRDFKRLTGVQATALDMFDREQYRAFHEHEPPEDWREATPSDIRNAAGNERPHIVFLSAPCKGFSGLLSESRSKGDKYQALNRLTLRGIWLMLEAWADDPPELIIFENVPRIASRGRALLDRIGELLHSYGYAVAETTHDCGEIGGLAQSRKRFLMVARHAEKVPAFLYQPTKRPLRAVGEVLEKMPMPGDPLGGPMHAMPNLQWKTWVRLAFVEAGSDWRSLNKLAVQDGYLKDFLIVPEFYGDVLGVIKWEETAGAISGRGGATNGAYSVADPRQEAFTGSYGVIDWERPAGTVAGDSLPCNGKFAVADPRFDGERFVAGQYGVRKWEEPTGVVTSQRSPGQGAFSVADPRMPGNNPMRQNGIYRIVKWNGPSGSVTGAAHVAGAAMSVADPRPPDRPLFRKYHITPWNQNTGTVIGGHHSEEGAYAVADPRMPDRDYHVKKYKVADWQKPSRTVISNSTTGDGAFAVADPRITRGRDSYKTAGEYGVLPWNETCGAIQSHGQYDNGRWSVADPRLPIATQKLVAVIRSLDDTWHRPFTTLELAALQSLVDPDEMFELEGQSDSAKRERIGNAVPPGAAEAIAGVMGETLLLAWSGERFMLSAQPIWVQPIVVALSVKTS
jgi:site-specific DNA-cytosine methylase